MFSARTGQARIGYRPSKKSIQRAVEKVHALTGRSGTWQETTTLVSKVNRTLRGWATPSARLSLPPSARGSGSLPTLSPSARASASARPFRGAPPPERLRRARGLRLRRAGARGLRRAPDFRLRRSPGPPPSPSGSARPSPSASAERDGLGVCRRLRRTPGDFASADRQGLRVRRSPGLRRARRARGLPTLSPNAGGFRFRRSPGPPRPPSPSASAEGLRRAGKGSGSADAFAERERLRFRVRRARAPPLPPSGEGFWVRRRFRRARGPSLPRAPSESHRFQRGDYHNSPRPPHGRCKT